MKDVESVSDTLASLYPATMNVVTLADVEPERVQWLWRYRIAAGKLTLLVGDPEAGKSTIALDIAAHVSNGRAFPDGAPCPRGDVLYCTLEDGLADTIRPRLDAAGADCDRVHSITAIFDTGVDGRRIERTLTLPEDLDHIRDVVVARGVKLVVLDPLKGFMSGGGNEWRDGDVRRLLTPLARLAEQTGVAVLTIVHLTKAAATPAQYRVSGSIAFTAAARSVLLAAPDPEAPDSGRRVFAPLKCSLSRRPETLAYELGAPDGSDDGPARVLWRGVSTVTAREALAPTETPEEHTASDNAYAFLTQELQAGPRPAKTVRDAARAVGISDRTLDRAKWRRGVVACRVGGIADEGHWVWALPVAGDTKNANSDIYGALGVLSGAEGQNARENAGVAKTATPSKSANLARSDGANRPDLEVHLQEVKRGRPGLERDDLLGTVAFGDRGAAAEILDRLENEEGKE